VPEDQNRLAADASSAPAEHRRRALEHPTRRMILRALHRHPEAQTLAELCGVVPNANTSTVGYHLRVLERGGCVSVVGEIVHGDGVLPTYVSSLADDRTATMLLRETRAADERDE
jgi:DNA-binding transcriptional ArsR family regulator